MTLSIRTGDTPHRQRFLEQATALQERTRAQLASGRRIAAAADDAAGLAISRRLEAAVRSAERGERNVADARDLVRTADAALETSQEALVRMRELSVQARNGTLSAGDRDQIQREYDQLAAQLDQTAGGVTFGGLPLLDGSRAGDGAIAVATGEAGAPGAEIEIDDASAAALGVRGLDVAAADTLDALDRAQQALNDQRSRLGALDVALTGQQRQLEAAREGREAARSRIEDLDVARAVAENARDRILTDLTLTGQRVSEQNRARVLDLLD